MLSIKSVGCVCVCTGLLTINPKQRLTMCDLLNNEWINGMNAEVLSTTPLATPDVLSLLRGRVNTIQNQITATLSAFHKAHRAGFRLQDVSNAPLVRRRKRMREECGSSGSTDSSRASTPVPSAAANVPSPLAVSATTSPTPLGVVSPSPGTAGFQLATTHDGDGGALPPMSMFATSKPASAVSDSAAPQQNDSGSSTSCEFDVRNSPASSSHSPSSHRSPAVESSSSSSLTVNHSSSHTPATDYSSSSRESTPHRSPISRSESIVSLGFCPAAASSAANSSENSSHACEPTAASAAAVMQISSPSAASLLVTLSSSHGSDSRQTVGSSKRKLENSTDQPRNDDNDDDDDCVIIGVSDGIASSSSDKYKKLRTQL